MRLNYPLSSVLLVSSVIGVANGFHYPFVRRTSSSRMTSSPSLSSSSPLSSSTTRLYLENLEQKTPDDREVSNLLQNYGEQSRIYRRNVFTSADWVRVRRSDRFVDNVLTTFQSGLIRQIAQEIILIFCISFFVVTYNDFVVDGWKDFGGTFHAPLAGKDTLLPALKLPLQPFTLTMSALGLLLAFRTNVSYARWNEARTAWGKVINDSRSIARMGCVWAKAYKDESSGRISNTELQRLGDAICSFSRSLMNRTLPPQEDEQNFLQYTRTKIQDQKYANVLRNAKHRPTAALAEITQILVDWDLNPLHQVEVEKMVTGLCDALGASERIFTSPVPTFYTRHTARFLAVWLFCLPAALYEPFGSTVNHWMLVPSMIVLSGFLLGIEELATQMEEPFSILPMEKMCEGSIRTPVMEQIERSSCATSAIESLTASDIARPTITIPKAEAREKTTQMVQEATELSEQDKQKIAQYFDSGSQMTMEELNQLWANQSGSKN